MTFYTICLAAIAVMQMLYFSTAVHPDVLLPSDSEQGVKVRPVFTAEAVEDGWYIWSEAEGKRMYKVFVQRASWDEAEATCVSNGGHLASIESEEENDFIYEISKANVGNDHNEVLWIGGRQKDFPSSREWTWSDGRFYKYENWGKGEPNRGPDGEDREHCIQYFNSDGYFMDWPPKKWNDFNCEAKMRAFVCARKPVFAGVPVQDGWYIWPEKERMYKVFVQRASWDKAEATCVRDGGHLASIESEEENDFIYELSKANVENNHNEVLWIGGKQKDFPSSREWTWSDGRPYKYENWGEGEPNRGPDGEDREHCIQFFNSDGTFMGSPPKKWNDFNCEEKMKGFVCKK